MPDPIRILFRLCGGFGFGDIVQFGVVLKHLRKHRPDWIVDVKSQRGAHSALHGLCNRSLAHDDPEPGPYDRTTDLQLDNTFASYADRPSNKTAYLLARTFGIDYDPECGRYEVRVTGEAMRRAEKYLRNIARREAGDKFGVVVIHYEGSSSPTQKNLAHWQADAICHAVVASGRVPVILDWHRRSPLPDGRKIFCPGCDDPLWAGMNNGDAETIAALVRQSEAYIGVDSGPGKVASSTDTPTLICWTKHHPLNYHDPAANTTHLISDKFLLPDECVLYFCHAYDYIYHHGDHGLISQALLWLRCTLDCSTDDIGVRFVIPQGMKAAEWCVAKMRNIACGRPIEVIVSGDRRRGEGEESLAFLRSFDWINRVSVQNIPVHTAPERPTNTRGHYLYVSDGVRGGYHFLVPNVVFERGGKLEDWMPDVPAESNLPRCEVEATP